MRWNLEKFTLPVHIVDISRFFEQKVQAYVHGYWIAALLGLLAAVSYWWHRRSDKALETLHA